MTFSLEIKHYDHDGPIVIATNEEIGLLSNLFHALSVPLTEPWLEWIHIYQIDGPKRQVVRWVDRYDNGHDEDSETHAEQSNETPSNVVQFIRPWSQLTDVPPNIIVKGIKTRRDGKSCS